MSGGSKAGSREVARGLAGVRARGKAAARRVLVAGVAAVHIPGMSEALAATGITLNGKPRDVPAGSSVSDLLAAVGLDGRKVAVERNEEIVPRSAYGTTVLAAGDAIEIVHFIGGG